MLRGVGDPSRELVRLAEALADAMPKFSTDEQRLALALYRHLSRGEPVAAAALAADVEGGESEVERTLTRWPGVYRDDDGLVVAFGGLAIPEMPHRFGVNGRGLYTWCAWDALFIPELIGKTAAVESRSPASGAGIRLTVTPDAVLDLEPSTAVVSMLAPTQRFDDRVIQSFCHFVHFFSSPEDARLWLAEHSDTFLLTVGDAFELGRTTNRLAYGEALSAARA